MGRGSFGGEALGDGEDPDAGEVFAVDALHYWCGVGVGFELVESFAVGCFAGVGVWADVGEAVAIGWASAEVAAFDFGLGGHGGSDADLDAVAFAFGHAAEDGHDQVVGFGFGVDRAADLGDPQLDAVVDEHGERQPELVAVERALGFTDDDGVEPTIGLFE